MKVVEDACTKQEIGLITFSTRTKASAYDVLVDPRRRAPEPRHLDDLMKQLKEINRNKILADLA